MTTTLEEIKTRWAAVTDQPWEAVAREDPNDSSLGHIELILRTDHGGFPPSDEDIEAVEHARTDVASLLKHIEEQFASGWKAIDEANSAASGFKEQRDEWARRYRELEAKHDDAWRLVKLWRDKYEALSEEKDRVGAYEKRPIEEIENELRGVAEFVSRYAGAKLLPKARTGLRDLCREYLATDGGEHG